MSPKTSLAAATRFARLLNLSERRPELALRVGIRWLRDGGSPAMLEVFHRAVTILVEMAASREGQASDAVRSLIEEASALLADIAPGVREAADRELSFSISRPTARVSVSAVRLTDADDLERLAASWDNFEWCRWLLRGFEAVAAKEEEVHLAFPPLRLYPVGNYEAQLADALTHGQSRYSVVPDRVFKALRDHLSGEALVSGQERSFWRLFRLLGTSDPNALVARNFLPRLEGLADDFRADVVQEICAYAWVCCANEAARLEFIEQLESLAFGEVAGWRCAASLEDACSWLEEWRPQTAKVLREILREMESSASIQEVLETMFSSGKLPRFASVSLASDKNDFRAMIEDLANRWDDEEEAWQMPDPIDAEELIRALEPSL